MSWLRAALRWMQAAFVAYQIHETEQYLRACARDGLVDSLSLRDFRAQLEALRVKRITLES